MIGLIPTSDAHYITTKLMASYHFAMSKHFFNTDGVGERRAASKHLPVDRANRAKFELIVSDAEALVAYDIAEHYNRSLLVLSHTLLSPLLTDRLRFPLNYDTPVYTAGGWAPTFSTSLFTVWSVVWLEWFRWTELWRMNLLFDEVRRQIGSLPPFDASTAVVPFVLSTALFDRCMEWPARSLPPNTQLVGPILSSSATPPSNSRSDDVVTQWLDRDSSPVIFVAIEQEMHKSSLNELIEGLRRTPHRVLWVLRNSTRTIQQLHAIVQSHCGEQKSGVDGRWKAELSSLLPHSIVLSHSAVKAFVAQPSFARTMEAVWHLKPSLLIPNDAPAGDPVTERFVERFGLPECRGGQTIVASPSSTEWKASHIAYSVMRLVDSSQNHKASDPIFRLSAVLHAAPGLSAAADWVERTRLFGTADCCRVNDVSIAMSVMWVMLGIVLLMVLQYAVYRLCCVPAAECCYENAYKSRGGGRRRNRSKAE